MVEDSVSSWCRELAQRLTQKLKKSRALHERALKVLPRGVTYMIRYFEPYPFYVTRAKGVNIWDVDGNVYDDYWMGHGALILGHAPDSVLSAIANQLPLGSHYGYAHELEIALAELICKHVPNVEMVRFTNSGTEANMYAVRLARAYTRRKKIVKFEGGWHGGYDDLHTGVHPPFRGPESGGLPEECISNTLVVPYNDPEPLKEALKGRDVAAVIIEPVLGAGGMIPAKREFLEQLRELCDRYGTLLIFDEVITGFRLALGGGQEFFKVDADIVVMGKIIGGGFLIGAFASRTEIMELLDHIKHPPAKGGSFHGGTFTGNPISMVGGIATIKELEKPEVYERLNEKGNRIRSKLAQIASSQELPVHITGAGSMVGIHFTRRHPINSRIAMEERWSSGIYRAFHMFMLIKGISLMTESMPHLLLAVPHQDKHLDKVADAFEEFLEEANKRIRLNS